ncbi:hypothetical protein VTI74DRAFT_1115 [Chaetomium olivicolor]
MPPIDALNDHLNDHQVDGGLWRLYHRPSVVPACISRPISPRAFASDTLPDSLVGEGVRSIAIVAPEGGPDRSLLSARLSAQPLESGVAQNPRRCPRHAHVEQEQILRRDGRTTARWESKRVRQLISRSKMSADFCLFHAGEAPPRVVCHARAIDLHVCSGWVMVVG